MVESIYFLKPAWCGTHFAGLWPEQGFQPVTRATALRRWFVTHITDAAGLAKIADTLGCLTVLGIAPWDHIVSLSRIEVGADGGFQERERGLRSWREVAAEA